MMVSIFLAFFLDLQLFSVLWGRWVFFFFFFFFSTVKGSALPVLSDGNKRVNKHSCKICKGMCLYYSNITLANIKAWLSH